VPCDLCLLQLCKAVQLSKVAVGTNSKLTVAVVPLLHWWFVLSALPLAPDTTQWYRYRTALAAWLSRFLVHSQLDTHIHTHTVVLPWMNDQLRAETATWQQTTRNRRTSMLATGFNPATRAWLYTHSKVCWVTHSKWQKKRRPTTKRMERPTDKNKP